MIARCECINIRHNGVRCGRDASKVCDFCFARLCGGCVKNHHGHLIAGVTFSPIKREGDK